VCLHLPFFSSDRSNMTDNTPIDEGRSGGELSGEPPVRQRGARLARFAILVAGSLAAAAAIILVAVRFIPPITPKGSASPADDVPADSGTPAVVPARAASPAVIRPTILLAATAAPGTAEQFQEEARGVANELRSRFPDRAEALHVVALLHSQLRQTAEAEKLWQQCIALSPKHEGYYVNLAAVLMDRGDSEQAAKTLQQALAAGGSSLDVYHHLATSLANLGRCEEAESTIRKALAADPQSSACWLVLGQTQLKLGKAAEAEASLRKAVELGSRSASTYYELGNACARQGKDEEAAKYRKLFTEMKAAQPLPPQQRYQVLSTAEARRTAVAILCEAATVHAWQKDTLEAERLLLRAVALDPTNAETCRTLAGLYQEGGLAAEEQTVRRRLVEIEPHHLVNYLSLAQVSARLGDNESAEAALKAAIAERPGAVDPYLTLAQFCLQTGKARHARWYAQEAVRRAPTAEHYRLLGSTCRLTGDDAAATAAFAAARKLAPGGDEPRPPDTGTPPSKP
jgi:tetratricopeptide (TPR) repeat protein